jgi:hypothetical protein
MLMMRTEMLSEKSVILKEAHSPRCVLIEEFGVNDGDISKERFV